MSESNEMPNNMKMHGKKRKRANKKAAVRY